MLVLWLPGGSVPPAETTTQKESRLEKKNNKKTQTTGGVTHTLRNEHIIKKSNER